MGILNELMISVQSVEEILKITFYFADKGTVPGKIFIMD